MLRLVVTVVLGSALALGAAWYFDLLPKGDEPDAPPTAPASPQVIKKQLGAPLYAEAPFVEEPLAGKGRPGPDPVVLPDFHLVPKDKVTLASQKDGQILFIGEVLYTQMPNDPTGPPPEVLRVAQPAPVRIGKDEKGKELQVVYFYRRLDRDSKVAPGQLVAMINPTLAVAGVAKAEAKKASAQAELKAAVALEHEAGAQVMRLDRARSSAVRQVVSEQEYAAARLTREKYEQEKYKSVEAIKAAEAELNEAEAVYDQHKVLNKLVGSGKGIIKSVVRSTGDTVKAQEPLMEIYSLENLRAEGLADVQYQDRLTDGASVTLEPVIFQSPYRSIPGHRNEITGVAFSVRGPNLRVVSASEDKTVQVWHPTYRSPLRQLFHPDAVRAVACAPAVAAKAWCVSGCADGSLRVWDLDAKDDTPAWSVTDADSGAHRSAVTALAFSPDGRFFASGGEDGMIHVWRTEGCRLVYRFDAAHGATRPHEGPITALHFTPQCRLVSAARDNTLRVWELHEKGVYLDPKHIVPGRRGTVAALGVSHDGSRMLYDQGRRLQVLSVKDGRMLRYLEGTFGSTPFETLALFSPGFVNGGRTEGELVLTAGAPEGRMQLWWVPRSGAERPFEVRQLLTREHSPMTCAAFAPDVGSAADGSWAVSGSKDGTVYLWKMPTLAQVGENRIKGLPLTIVDRALDANARQLRLSVDVPNPADAQHPYGRLAVGQSVTVVIEPQP
jgi:WD40 repeat protein